MKYKAQTVQNPHSTPTDRPSQRTSSTSIRQQWSEQPEERVCRHVLTRMSSAMISVRISSACRCWMRSSSTTSCLHRAVERFRRARLSRSDMPQWNIFLGHAGGHTDLVNGWQTGSARSMPTKALNVDDFDYYCFDSLFCLLKGSSGTQTRSVASQHAHGQQPSRALLRFPRKT